MKRSYLRKLANLTVTAVVLLAFLTRCWCCGNPSYRPTLAEAVSMSTIVLQGLAINHTAGPNPRTPIVTVSVECIFKDDGRELEHIIQVVEAGDMRYSGLCFESELTEGLRYVLFVRDGGDGSFQQQAAALQASAAHLDSGCGLGGQARSHPLPRGVSTIPAACPTVSYQPCPSTAAPIHSHGRRTKPPRTKRPHHTAPPRTTAPDVTTPLNRKHPRSGSGSSSSLLAAMATWPLGMALLGPLLLARLM